MVGGVSVLLSWPGFLLWADGQTLRQQVSWFGFGGSMLPCMAGSPFLQETPGLTTRVQPPWTLAEDSSLLRLAIEASQLPKTLCLQTQSFPASIWNVLPLSLPQLLFYPCGVLFLPVLPTFDMQTLSSSYDQGDYRI